MDVVNHYKTSPKPSFLHIPVVYIITKRKKEPQLDVSVEIVVFLDLGSAKAGLALLMRRVALRLMPISTQKCYLDLKLNHAFAVCSLLQIGAFVFSFQIYSHLTKVHGTVRELAGK